jgi:hypothetical protein
MLSSSLTISTSFCSSSPPQLPTDIHHISATPNFVANSVLFLLYIHLLFPVLHLPALALAALPIPRSPSPRPLVPQSG